MVEYINCETCDEYQKMLEEVGNRPGLIHTHTGLEYENKCFVFQRPDGRPHVVVVAWKWV